MLNNLFSCLERGLNSVCKYRLSVNRIDRATSRCPTIDLRFGKNAAEVDV